MEEKQLNEKESLQLITQMIRNTQRKFEKGSGIPFLVWGYTTVIVSLAVWYMLTRTLDYRWNGLWLAIPVIGYPIMMLSIKNNDPNPKTYIDKIITYVWIVFGVSAFILSVASAFVPNFPILFSIVLLISMGTAITGLIIKFGLLSIAGFIGMGLSFMCLIVNTADSILIFAALFLLVQVIPGHILNYKSRKNHV